VTSQFVIHGLEAGSDALGLWQVAASPESFASPRVPTNAAGGGSENPPPIVWSVSLPADTADAQRSVQQQRHVLQTTHIAIAESGRFLENLSPSPEMVSFGAAGIANMPDPEARLVESLAHLQGDEAAVSFGSGFLPGLPGLPADWRATVAGYQAFVQQTLQLMRPTLRVETKIEEVLLACTQVRLTGDFDTVWVEAEQVNPQSQQSRSKQQMHQQILSLTIQSRLAILRLLAQTSVGAAALAARFAIPGGAMVALPAAWRYIQDVVKQAQQLVALKQLREAQ
jgi:hypothetical protein